MSGSVGSTTPTAFVECAACRENGVMVGDWFDADELPTMMDEWNAAMAERAQAAGDGAPLAPPRSHADHEDGDLWISDLSDWDGTLSEECHPSLGEMVWDLIEDLSDEDRAAFGAYTSHCSIAPGAFGKDTLDEFREAYAGTWDSEEEYAQNLADDIYGTGPDHLGPLHNYIDWASFARDLFMSDYFSVDVGYRVMVFRNV